jgi:hypothetical protein
MSQTTGVSNRTKRDGRRETVVAWVVVLILVFTMIISGFISIWTIGDRGQSWQYRTAPLVPGETYSSTQPVSTSTQAPKQVELPPATVGKKAK